MPVFVDVDDFLSVTFIGHTNLRSSLHQNIFLITDLKICIVYAVCRCLNPLSPELNPICYLLA
jgi:transposase